MDGRYFYSKFASSKSNALRSFAQRFSDSGLRVPGPGQYDHPKPVNAEGRNFVSQYKSCAARTFGSERRKSALDYCGSIFYLIITVATPGPGTYVAPSDFGIYENMNRETFDPKFNSTPRVAFTSRKISGSTTGNF